MTFISNITSELKYLRVKNSRGKGKPVFRFERGNSLMTKAKLKPCLDI